MGIFPQSPAVEIINKHVLSIYNVTWYIFWRYTGTLCIGYHKKAVTENKKKDIWYLLRRYTGTHQQSPTVEIINKHLLSVNKDIWIILHCYGVIAPLLESLLAVIHHRFSSNKEDWALMEISGPWMWFLLYNLQIRTTVSDSLPFSPMEYIDLAFFL